MKRIIYFLSLLVVTSCIYAQSPFYSIKFSVVDDEAASHTYTISRQVCEFDYTPVINSGDYWFGKDTSMLNWNSLPDTMYKLLKCGDESLGNGMIYENSNQAMVWENIYKFKIIRTGKNTGTSDTMTIVFPVLLKSFVTFIKLGTIRFAPGYYEPIYDFKYSYDEYLNIKLPEGYTWNSINFEDRKIKIN